MLQHLSLMLAIMSCLAPLLAQIEQIQLNFEKGEKYYQEQQWGQARKAWDECERSLPASQDSLYDRARIQNNLAAIEFQQGNLKKAQQQWFACLQLISPLEENRTVSHLQNTQEQKLLGIVHQNLSLVYQRLNNQKKAQESHKKAQNYLGNHIPLSSAPILTPLFMISSSPSPSHESSPSQESPSFQTQLLWEENGQWVPCSSKTMTMPNDMLIKLQIKTPCYAYAYLYDGVSKNECEFIPGLSITPEQFVHGQCLLTLHLASILKQRKTSQHILLWYCSHQKIEDPLALNNPIQTMLQPQHFAFRGLQEQEPVAQPIEYAMQQKVILAVIPPSSQNGVHIEQYGEFKILHSPLQVSLLIQERQARLQHNDVLYCGEHFQLIFANHDPQPLYLYAFHCDEYKQVSQLLPRPNQTVAVLQPGERDILKNATESYCLDENPGWEYVFFFYRTSPEDATVLYNMVKSLAQNKNALTAFIQGQKGNALVFRNYSDIVDLEDPIPPAQQQNWKNIVVLKFYKQAKK